MTVHEAQQQLLTSLYELYDNREAATIADWVMEHVTGMRKIDRIMHKQSPLAPDRLAQLQQYTRELLAHKPVQYVLHEAWFCGMPFYVDENVLIPRPETEELVEWIVKEVSGFKFQVSSLLDIGTGSGCIPVALKKKLPNLKVYALDVSEAALNVAQKNANALNASITFYKNNILEKAAWYKLPVFDIIVSNPPYIRQSEEKEMRKNVLLHEPHLAVFVPDEDALVFYKAIAEFGLTHLNKEGRLFFEINEALGNEVKQLLEEHGYSNVEVKKDMQGKERMVKAVCTL